MPSIIFRKHQATLASQLSHWRDVQVARKSFAGMAGDPLSVLDLPCGAGRFWPMLAEQPAELIIGSDNSENMIATAMHAQPVHVVSRVQPLCKLQRSILTCLISAVDSIFCMRSDASYR
jgi:2-polyprenyl-3-methyl-5-hydroxy-6-metoxy-1,4-benzoquinol methylase